MVCFSRDLAMFYVTTSGLKLHNKNNVALIYVQYIGIINEKGCIAKSLKMSNDIDGLWVDT